MVRITVNLTPPLTGVKGEMWIMFVVGGVESWYYLMDIPTSVNGVIGPFGYTDGYPNNIHQIRFPEQTINGVTYLETQTSGFMTTQDWTFNITLTPAPVGIPTTTTLSAPDKAGVEEKFYISGILYETDSGIPIPNHPINHSYDGRTLGSSTTGVDGDYLKEVSIPESGVWTIKSEFPGTETLQASSSLKRAIVEAPTIAKAILIAGPIAIGVVLFIYGIMPP